MKKNYAILVLYTIFNCIYTNAQTQIGSTVYGSSNEENFGTTIEMNSQGNIIAVAADGTDTVNGNGSGIVKVYEFNTSTSEWEQKGNDILGQNSGDKFGASLSLNGNGNLLAIGAVLNDLYGFQSGMVQVYEFNTNTNEWVQKGNNLTNGLEDYFTGNSISFNDNGDRIAIGTPIAETNGIHRGNVIVFDFDTNNNDWIQVGSLINGTQDYTNLGYAVSLNSSGNTLVAGGPGLYRNGNPGIVGVVKVFNLVNDNWVQKGQDINGTQISDLFGGAVDISSDGNSIVIGASSDDQNIENSGKIEVYSYNNSQWTKKGETILGNNGDWLGGSVDINNDGSKILAGSFGFDNDKGKVELFEFTNSNWELKGNPIVGVTTGDRLGFSSAMNQDGSSIAVGTYRNDDTNEYFKVFNTNTTLSVDDVTSASKIHLYFKENQLNIKSDILAIKGIKLYNSLGQEIKFNILEPDFSRIDFIDSKNTDIYFIKIKTEKGILNKKLLYKKV